MPVFTVLNGYVRDYRKAIRRRRTERMIGSLPSEIRKDIGWPGVYRTNLPIDGANNDEWAH